MNALEPGGTLGGYRILARLRAGAMGVLYLARREATPAGFSRPVAIKVIHDHLAQNKRFCRMFIDEAKLSARIDDPHVVRVDEFGQADGRYYIVMEFVHGASLAQTIGVLRKRGRIPIEQAVAIAMQIASGLHGAHEATDEEGKALGIVHRDVSPHNVLVSFKGNVRVIDFGIAKAAQVGGQTKTGSLRGKLAYMPPEQARSARTVDRRADLYGVGLILWEMLTFRRVFDAETDIAILNQIRAPQIVPPSTLRPSVPKALDEILMRTLAKEPDDRPATGLALQRALAEAFPAALQVLPGDLAGLMNKVRDAADATGGGDDSALYGEELRRTVRTFAGSMNESVEQASEGSVRTAPVTEEVLDTRPSRPDLGADASPPAPVIPASEVFEDETTKRRQAALRQAAGAVALRPGDGVRPLVPSSPDVLIPPPPLSSSRALVARAIAPPPSSSRAIPAGRPSSSPDVGAPSPADPTVPVPRPTTTLEMKQKVILAVGVVLTGVVIACAAILGGKSEAKTPAPAPVASDAAAAKPALAAATLVAPVVIAPPDPVEDIDAAPVKSRTKGR